MSAAPESPTCSSVCMPGSCAPDPSIGSATGKATVDPSTRLAELAKALGHPARVQILQLLIARTACICGDIVEVLPLAQSTVSQHLKVLKEAGLIQGEIDGPRVCYCVQPAALAEFKALVAGL